MICSDKNRDPHKEVFLTPTWNLAVFLSVTVGWETQVQKKFASGLESRFNGDDLMWNL